jgi:hypothetical protein
LSSHLLAKNIKIGIYKTIILPLVLYGSLSLREDHRLKMFDNKVLRIFGPRRDEATGGRRKLHNAELQNFYFSPTIITNVKSRRMRWAVP